MATKAPPVGPEAPMPPAPSKEVFQTAIVGNFDGSTTITLLYYYSTLGIGAATGADQVALVALLSKAGGLVDAMVACCTADWEATAVTTFCPTSPALATMLVPLVPKIGQATGSMLPAHTAVTIQKRTNWRGRHGRGRISVPAVPRDAVQGTRLTASGSYNVLSDRIIESLDDGTRSFIPVVFAQSREKPRTFGIAAIVRAPVDVVLGTCRRRKPGVGI